MPKTKLTDTFATQVALVNDQPELIYWDTDVIGFGLRVRPVSKTWIMAYRPVGAGRSINTKKLRLSTFPSLKTGEARRLAREMAGRIAAGEDPAAERAELRRKETSSVAALLGRYNDDLGRRGYVNRKTVITGLQTRLAPFLTQDVKTVSGADLWAVIESLQKSGKEGAAEDFRSRSRAFFSWCIKTKAIQAHPLLGYRKERATRADVIAKQGHGRALSDNELLEVWRAANLAAPFGRLIRFLILTGCRRGEGAGLAWAMIDRDNEIINLPAAFVKQGRGHSVPITPALAELLDACPVSAGSDLVFPSTARGGPMSGWSDLRGALSKKAGVEFKLHDLRRTFRTGLSRLGVNSDVAELAMGHARAGLEATYNRDVGLAALREAFQIWAAHVVALAKKKKKKS